MSDFILEARNLKKYYEVNQGLFCVDVLVKAVDGVSFDIYRGETFAIVGESGCGKSTLGRVLNHLITPTEGEVIFEGEDISKHSGKELSAFRKEVQFIFQDPFSSLNPRMTVGRLISEPLEIHRSGLSAKQREDKVKQLLEQVGLRVEHANRYPHEFSGGQRQRIGIARALASGPKLIIGDEPVSALDVSVQAQVVNLLDDLRDELNLTLIVIAHDLSIVRHMSDRVAVMYLGKIVEMGPVDEVFSNPCHPYTLSLLSAVPEPVVDQEKPIISLSGETPSPTVSITGCRLNNRCQFARDICWKIEPEISMVETCSEHTIACHFWHEVVEEVSAKTTSAFDVCNEQVEMRLKLYQAALKGKKAVLRKRNAVKPEELT
ncbi:dipeptide ABC transporter ATP-binding protein [Pseudovibrio sp. Ad26]|uniref:ABC transporter ATP-binding protein n=1 Tax=Pseudovibrio sp. Ad26 TaxID=989410 RepID=UPI0007B30334|nr:dipeptide ABC transporter ATP-binding protein [Pseudovibrio sp. Ad26]KZL09040.1 Oligopeptide transport ATP-binding protein OppF [Pseudovibrio sp. Ad26]